MKKIIVMLAFCLLSVSLFARGQAANQPFIEKTVAVLEFEEDSELQGGSIALTNLFSSQLANKNVFNVLTQTNVEAIMSKHNFQRSGVTGTENIAVGKLVNADYIVVGKIATLGDSALLTIQIINVMSGNIEVSGDVSFKDLGDTVPFIDSMVDSIVAIETKPVPKTDTKSATYKIGDVGPGGGLIFYIVRDKYFESSENLGEANWYDAHTLAKNYRGGGYDDWYLPTKEELNYIYVNLYRKGLIPEDEWFWSSSEYDNNIAWRQRFGIDYQHGGNLKTYNFNVRVVRAF